MSLRQARRAPGSRRSWFGALLASAPDAFGAAARDAVSPPSWASAWGFVASLCDAVISFLTWPARSPLSYLVLVDSTGVSTGALAPPSAALVVASLPEEKWL